MFFLTHPTGNTFVRAALEGLDRAGLLAAFATTIGVSRHDGVIARLPRRARAPFHRRAYDLPAACLKTFPLRETARLAAARLGAGWLIRHETGWASVDAVYRDLDARAAAALPRVIRTQPLTGVYCYEDGALATFLAAKRLGLRRVYDLPIAYWETSRRLLREEAERWPAWEPTLVGTRDSTGKLERKSDEIALADIVICPSAFVRDSLPSAVRRSKPCIVAEFGSPVVAPARRPDDSRRPLRVLFAGTLTQRKGLADLFEAFRLLNRSDVELVAMGSLVAPLEFYRRQGVAFCYEGPRPHHAVLDLMQSCDVFVLPSIVEGRALVQQEAMACGLPLIATANAGGADLIEEGRSGFLVPIRQPERLAERIGWLADHRGALPDMRAHARRKAAEYTWSRYQATVLEAVAGRASAAQAR